MLGTLSNFLVLLGKQKYDSNKSPVFKISFSSALSPRVSLTCVTSIIFIRRMGSLACFLENSLSLCKYKQINLASSYVRGEHTSAFWKMSWPHPAVLVEAHPLHDLKPWEFVDFHQSVNTCPCFFIAGNWCSWWRSLCFWPTVWTMTSFLPTNLSIILTLLRWPFLMPSFQWMCVVLGMSSHNINNCYCSPYSVQVDNP